MNIEEIKKRRSKITNNGNWFVMHGEDLMGNCGYDEPDNLGWVNGGLGDVGQNADFVANAPKDIDYLLSFIDRYKTLNISPGRNGEPTLYVGNYPVAEIYDEAKLREVLEKE